MNYLLFQILDGQDPASVQEELERKGLKDIYWIEEEKALFIGGRSRKKITTDKAILTTQQGEVDWEQQWALYAEGFSEGKAHIDLTPFGSEKTILLNPGPGFGDLSHPTTYLMLEMMKGNVAGESIVDVGTGSGILAIAAIQLGARLVYGIDIDPAAIAHAKENGKLNQLSSHIHFSKALPKKLEPSIFLMNMILPEQRIFNPARFNTKAKQWIVSGILQSQREEYLAQAAAWEWTLQSEHHRSEWSGFIFKS